MAKRLKFDESGDSDDLQALFDSIASSPVKPRLEVINDTTDAGDDDELQALFDSVAAEFGDAPGQAELPAQAVEVTAAAAEAPPESGNGAVFNRIGQMTRQLHDTCASWDTTRPCNRRPSRSRMPASGSAISRR